MKIADLLWFEGSNNITGYSRLGEFRVFNNVTNIPGKYVYFDFMGVTSDYDGDVPNRSGGGGYNLTTDKDLVDGNARSTLHLKPQQKGTNIRTFNGSRLKEGV